MQPHFLHITAAEITRAQSRINQPAWQPAATLLKTEAQTAATRWPTLPTFDATWFDANPTRPYNETYNEFAAYAYPATRLLGDAFKLLLADAVTGETQYTKTALAWTKHIVDSISFHVKHHDAGLNYAHAATALAAIYTYAQDSLSEQDKNKTLAQLKNVGEALKESTAHWLKNLAHMPYNNHFAHHRLGLLAVAVVLNNTEWQNEALTGPRNFGELLAGSTTDDGLCYESSTVYHFVTLSGLLQTAALVHRNPQLKRDLFREIFANGRRLKDMFDAPLNLLLPNGELPSIGDCYSYRQPLWELRAPIYEQAYAIYKDPKYAWILQKAGNRNSIDALLFGEDEIGAVQPPQIKTRLWPEHGYALLTPGTPAYENAAFLTTDLSGIHHHHDTLSLQLALGKKIWLDDPESEAIALQRFAAPIQREFNRTMLPHNLVTVDEHDQADCPRILSTLEFKPSADSPTITIADEGALLSKGVRRQRSVALTPDYCLDIFSVTSDTDHTYDYQLHPRTDTPIRSPLTFNPTTLPSTPPYSHLKEPRVADIIPPGATLDWSQGNQTLRCDLRLFKPSPAKLIRAFWPTTSDHSTPPRELFLFRIRAASATFLALYQLATPNPLWNIQSDTLYFNGQFHELRITVTNGERTRHHTFKSP